MTKKNIYYRLFFAFKNEVYQIYAKSISQNDHFWGFLAATDLSFSDPKAEVVVDPTEERLKSEFEGVNTIYIPMQAVLRIDEVEKPGSGNITSLSNDQKGTVSPFPGNPQFNN